MLEGKIQQYCDHTALQISEIAEIKNRLFQKILYASLLDTMGRSKFKNGKNHDRIVGFIDDCSSWGDRNRVSLVQLSLLGKDKIKPGSPLQTLIETQIPSWQHGTLPRPEADPLISDIAMEPEEIELVKQVRYAELFFHYRHTLIHEFREPGYGMEASADGSSPYYFGMNNQWELVFPVEFFKALCEDCLSGLRAYLIAKNIDPYTCYKFGSLWIQSKNGKG